MRFSSWLRHHAIAMAITVACPGLALGAPGDVMVVTGNGVNVRSAPTTSSRILLQVNRGEPATERSRDGVWVEVELPDRASRGWIHGSLLELVTAAPAPAPTAEQPPPKPEPPVAAAPPPQAPAAPSPMAPDEPAAETPETVAAREAEPTPTPTSPATPPSSATATAVGVGDDFALQHFQTSVDYLNDRAVAAAGIDLFEGIESGGPDNVRVNVTDAWALMPPSGRQSYLNTLFDRWVAATGSGGRPSLEIVAPDGRVVDEKTAP